MKKTFWIACLGCLLSLGSSAAFAASDPGGLMGLKWTGSESDCKKLNLCSERTLTVSDAIPQERLYSGKPSEMNGIPVRGSSFAFNENKFYMGAVFFDPRKASFEELKTSLVKIHGQPNSTGPRGAAWLLGKTRIILYKGESTHGVTYAHVPDFNKVAKLKNYPGANPPPAAPPKKKK
jgi:hypothetical protein